MKEIKLSEGNTNNFVLLYSDIDFLQLCLLVARSDGSVYLGTAARHNIAYFLNKPLFN